LVNAIRLTLLALMLLAGSSAADDHNSLTDEELSGGWILLFDGETLYGWQPNSKADWKAEGGVISVTSGEKGLLNTTSEFDDYVLKLDFRSAKGTNSGVFLRTVPRPSDPAKDCYELNIADSGSTPFPTGSFVGRKKAEGQHDSTDWQSYEVAVMGDRLLVKLDGQVVLDYTDPSPLGRGHIGLQLNEGKVEFRNIKLRPLGLASIFNGKDFSGWTVFPGETSVFSVTPEGALNVKNGRGQIETQASYGDFVLQLEVFVNGKHLNSGIFFRSIPGEFWNGYESQIHNGFRDADRSNPIDCGTGGFYRRQNARKVVANDFTWFHKTLLVSGKHMATWVNGYQVSDWTDPREPHANPRNGLRLEPGTLIIQGHDPTTDLSFRNLKAREMQK
jgi:hypothetical protein